MGFFFSELRALFWAAGPKGKMYRARGNFLVLPSVRPSNTKSISSLKSNAYSNQQIDSSRCGFIRRRKELVDAGFESQLD